MISFLKGFLEVRVFDNAELLAEQAGQDVRTCIQHLLNQKDEINMIFSAAESQELFLRTLAKAKDIEWNRINAFAVDEFIAPDINPEYRVCAQPEKLLYEHVPMKSVNTINFNAEDIEAERSRYERLIQENAPDIACLGIGVSGHIAFNEPGQSSFNEPQAVKIIDVHQNSRAQLLQDPNFKSLGTIPQQAVTVTIPSLMNCPNVFVITPYKIKAPIIKRLLEEGVSEDLPASILATKEGAKLYLDNESYSLYLESQEYPSAAGTGAMR